MRRGRPRSCPARARQRPQDCHIHRQRRRRHLCQPWLRALQGAVGCLWPHSRDEGRPPPEGLRHHGQRRRLLRPGGGGGPRRAARQQGEGESRGLTQGAGRRHHRELWVCNGKAPRGQGRQWQGADRQEHHPGPGVGALRSPRYYGRRDDCLHIRWSPEAPLRAPVRGHHRLRLHRPGVLRRLHCPRLRGYLHRGPGHAHAHIRPRDPPSG
mmetsp:Transcript_23659/g.52586  ORF Transcript_23659/g.52586 Transcript_23659/m.52586 type:complete len:211 (-) Transcript_23659:939-1571(-)